MTLLAASHEAYKLSSLRETEQQWKQIQQGYAINNWYGTLGPYVDFLCGFGLRMKELRIGHDKMAIMKIDEVTTEFQVRKYGLNGLHSEEVFNGPKCRSYDSNVMYATFKGNLLY